MCGCLGVVPELRGRHLQRRAQVQSRGGAGAGIGVGHHEVAAVDVHHGADLEVARRVALAGLLLRGRPRQCAAG
jgi:hypothetical protein